MLASIRWMENNGFFDENELGFDVTDIIFAETLEEKIFQIKNKQCSHFIDDLRKVLLHKEFPERTKKIHFSKYVPDAPLTSIDHYGNWQMMKEYLLEIIGSNVNT